MYLVNKDFNYLLLVNWPITQLLSATH